MSKAHSNANEDIYEDLDAPPEMSPLDDVSLVEDSMIVDAEADDLCIVKEILACPKEAELKRAEKKLYLEILKSEKEKRKEEELKVLDYDEVQKQSINFKKQISEKDEEIAKLKKENDNLKMNICSLYKTAKADSVQMELLLREANEKVDCLLYRRKLPKDYFGQLSSKTPSQKLKKNSQEKSSQTMAGSGTISQNGREMNNQSKEGSDTKEKNLNQPSGQQKRPHSPSGDSENPKSGITSCSNKRQNCDSNDIRNSSQTAIKESPNKKSDSIIVENNTSLANDKKLDESQNSSQNTSSMKTDSLDMKKSCDLSSLQDTACIDISKNVLKPISDISSGDKSISVETENLNKNQNTDLNSTNLIQSEEKDPEPSVEELFFTMQMMISNDPDTLNDPDTINLIFDNLLPDELKQWFIVYESSQADALHKLKRSFINSYFQQCSANTTLTSKVHEKKSAKPQNFSFFFQQSPSCSNTDPDVIILDEVSDLKNKAHENLKVKGETSS